MHVISQGAVYKGDVTLSIIVPVFNEQEVLELFHHRLLRVLSTLDEDTFEILYINDGSSDRSWEILQTLSAINADIHCINLTRNFGKEAALTAGIEHARGQAITILDADLQDPPELIPEMLAAWRCGYDVVNMKRSARLGESKFKVWTAHLYYRILDYLSDAPVERDVGDFRLISRRVVENIKLLNERNRYMKGILSWPGYKKATIEFDRPQRADGDTKWSFLQLVRLGVSGITAFSVKPLRLSTWAGALISLAAFAYGLWVLAKTVVFGEPVAGYPSMMLMQLFLGGVQLIAVGVLGEYVGRIFSEVKARPIYLVMDIEHKPQANGVVKKHAS
ncbi:glycosyltransferase [Microbulbifer agarilyticus]|uniref:Glycosyltransferase n=1 Tax=Microbulbifer agarilyticus TaxID=260552 RepID=A0A1Q2M4Q0_9GAMM|nr:glycosyltransferase family 2 protein [Microbulbifer agarilyticus]AQQ67636.1 glycosyltransferase [Microbulbifer agarilyticus]